MLRWKLNWLPHTHYKLQSFLFFVIVFFTVIKHIPRVLAGTHVHMNQPRLEVLDLSLSKDSLPTYRC